MSLSYDPNRFDKNAKEKLEELKKGKHRYIIIYVPPPSFTGTTIVFEKAGERTADWDQFLKDLKVGQDECRFGAFELEEDGHAEICMVAHIPPESKMNYRSRVAHYQNYDNVKKFFGVRWAFKAQRKGKYTNERIIRKIAFFEQRIDKGGLTREEYVRELKKLAKEYDEELQREMKAAGYESPEEEEWDGIENLFWTWK